MSSHDIACCLPAHADPSEAAATRSRVADSKQDRRRPVRGHSTILLLVDLRAPSSIAIERAIGLARTRRAALDVVAIVPHGWRREEHRPTVLARFALALGGNATELVKHVEVRAGSLRRVAFAAARTRVPDLVIIAEDADAGDRGAATALAELLDVPVLVARARQGSGSIVAATELDDLEYPVLRAAVELGEALQAPVMFLHNASPPAPIPVQPLLDPVSAIEEYVATKQARLRTLAHEAGADAIVVRTHATADAILEVARARDADLIVIGYRRRSWLSRLFRGRLVDDIVVRSRRSVLVLPIGH
jgi:nucleotide-binding universal stress UspA family protein